MYNHYYPRDSVLAWLLTHKKESFKNHCQYVYCNVSSSCCHANFKDLYFLLSRFLYAMQSFYAISPEKDRIL